MFLRGVGEVPTAYKVEFPPLTFLMEMLMRQPEVWRSIQPQGNMTQGDGVAQTTEELGFRVGGSRFSTLNIQR